MREIIEAIRNLTNRIQVLEVKEDPPTNILLFPQSSDLSLTTSYQDVPGCVHILPSNGFYLVEAICDVYTGNDDLDNGFYFQGRLEIDGVAQPLIVRAVLERTGGVRLGGLYKQTWRVALWDYRQIVLKKSPVGYWRLGEKTGTVAHDESGNLNHGTYTGGITLNQLGALANDSDTAAGLNGSSGTVSIPHAAGLKPSAAISLEAWVYPTDLGTLASREIYRKEDGTDRHLLSFQGTGTILAFGIATGGVYAELDVTITPAVWLNKWNHVVATYDGTTKRVYKDGAQIGFAAATGAVGTTGTANAYIGSSVGASEWFAGSVDEVAVYPAALSAADVLEDYNAGAGIGYSNASATIKLRASKSGGTGASQLLRNNTQLVITQLGKI